MTSIADGAVIIQTTSLVCPLNARHGSERLCWWLRIDGARDILTKIAERVRGCRDGAPFDGLMGKIALSCTLMLLDHPDQLEKLKADLSLVPAAVEELLRLNGPATTSAPRLATEDLELGGQQIKKGDIMFLFLLSADHDETQFTGPEELDIARQITRHLAFGQGIHICLGAPLARLEGEIALTTLLRCLPNLRLSVPRESITWRASGNLRGLTALPVAF